MTTAKHSICDVPGVLVGQVHDDRGKTGCTAILFQNGAVGGVDIRGSAPGVREIESLKPVRLISRINAIFLTGGSAFGLTASGGVQKFLEERGVGYDIGVTRVPIVPAAVIFDLGEGDHRVRPDEKMGYLAASLASAEQPEEGRVGVGRGATVGKLFGREYRMKGGVGTDSMRLGDVVVGVFVVVNAFGNVVDPVSGETVAGAFDPESRSFLDMASLFRHPSNRSDEILTNTTLAVVATDARLNKEEAIKVAQMAQNGLARALRPAHTPFDGDLVICVSVGDETGDIVALGLSAADLIAASIVRAVRIANRFLPE